MSETGSSILFATRKWAPATGGMETYCLRLTETLADHAEVQVVALSGGKNGMPPGAVALLLFPFTFIAACLRRSSPPQVLHLGDLAIWPLGLICMFWGETRLILSAHGTDVAYHRRGGIKGRLYGAYLRLGAKLLGNRARIIANSHATDNVTRETGWQDIAIVPLASDLPSPQKPSTPSRTILFAGRLVRRKGCAWFIRNVLPLIPEDVTLDVAGTVWDEEEKTALRDQRVRFLGPVSQQELAERYAQALCVVVPNIDAGNGEYEGFGLIAPEAAAAGGVVLAADHGGIKDAVIDGETGFLLPSEDAARWADAIARIAEWSEAQRSEFTGHASQLAREHYSWPRVARETLEAYALADMPEPHSAAGAVTFLDRAKALFGRMRAAIKQYKTPLLAFAIVIFAAGSVWSFASLGISFAEIDLLALALLIIPMGVVLLVYSGLSLMLLAHIAGVRIGFFDSLRVSAHAQMAEALPLPGGAIVRSAALISAGSSVPRSAALVVSTGIMWIALACTAAGTMMVSTVPLAGWTLIGGGALVLSGTFLHLSWVGGTQNALLVLLLRVVGLGLAAIRLWLAFAVILIVMPIPATFPYAFAAIAGSASALVPGGLGVGEALGALMADALGKAPEAAFLAVAINRIAQFLSTAIMAPLFEWRMVFLKKAAHHD